MGKLSVKHGRNWLLALIAIISAVLLITAIAMLTRYSDDLSVRADSEAKAKTLSAKAILYDFVADHTAKAVSCAVLLNEVNDDVEAYGVLSPLSKTQEFMDVKDFRYFANDGILYDMTGEPIEGYDIAREYYAQTPDKSGYIGVFDDVETTTGTMSLIGFYAPVNNSPYVEAVVIYYTRNKLHSFFPENGANDIAELSLLVLDNNMLEVLSGNEDLKFLSFKDELRGMVGKQDPVKQVQETVHQGVDGTVRITIGGRKYVVSIAADKERLKDLAVCELYSVDRLTASSVAIIGTIILIIVLFAVIALSVIVFLVIQHVKREREFFNMETTDIKLQCLNRHGFEKLAQKIIDRNKLSNANFYVVVVQLKHYIHILETYGETETSHLLLHLRMTIAKLMGLEETFGHVGEGQFLLLIHAKDKADITGRLKMLSYLSEQYKTTHKFDILLKYGVYEIALNENATISQMIDFANEANNSIVQATEENTNLQFNFYNNELRKIRLLNEDMELRMEGALKDGEFQLFYQPKYNLRLGKQDGAEALVRWYDPKTQKFNPPALFMQLFETNGFIVKLDKYVYTKVCEYISYTMSHGGTVYPISVNVSRITAVQPDFVDFYYNTKRKYGISDGLIMIEFTESFAYENYTTLYQIVNNLHSKGFKCSIDDFGCGYSSYRILKSLPMDEIKLDKFFLEKSDSEKRDLTIFKSIIDLAKDLGMKVTQEGVEVKEDLDLLIDLGCDVVQGYYYSYPLPLSDYIVFVASSKEHNVT